MIVLQQISDGRVVVRACGFDRAANRLGIVAVDVRHHVPAVGREALRRVVGEPAARLAVDRDAVVVVEGDQLAELAACRRTRTPRARCLPSCSRRRGTRTCSDRRRLKSSRLNSAARCFSASAMPTAFAMPWPSGPVVVSMPSVELAFRMPRHARAELAELLELVDADCITGQVGDRVQEHRAMAIRQARTGRGRASGRSRD